MGLLSVGLKEADWQALIVPIRNSQLITVYNYSYIDIMCHFGMVIFGKRGRSLLINLFCLGYVSGGFEATAEGRPT